MLSSKQFIDNGFEQFPHQANKEHAAVMAAEISRRRDETRSGRQQFDRRNFSEQIYTLWDELADFRPQAVDQALNHCLKKLREWLGADDACWIGAARLLDDESAATDPLNGWRIRVVKKLNEEECPRWEQNPSKLSQDSLYPLNRQIAALAGNFRIYNLCDGVIDLEAFTPPSHAHCSEQHGIRDRLWIIFPVTPMFESCFCFDIHQGNQFFSERELRIARDALRGIKWFHRKLLLSHGLGVNQSPLTPAERRVLLRLLIGDSEKSVAEQLNLAPGSVHQYCVRIYQKYGVHGRIELMSLWIKAPNDVCAR